VVDAVRRSNALASAKRHARDFTERARVELAALPGGAAREALERICEYVVERRL
jgi:heptaprenyl diphosphate synthase